MMAMKYFAWLIVFSAALTATGCTSPTAAPRAGITTGETLNLDQPVVLDESLQKKTLLGHRAKILVDDYGVRRGPTGTHEYHVLLRNVTDHDQHIQGRAHFMNDAGQEVEQPAPWQTVFIPARSIETYRVASTQTDGVKRFYVELRQAR